MDVTPVRSILCSKSSGENVRYDVTDRSTVDCWSADVVISSLVDLITQQHSGFGQVLKKFQFLDLIA